MSMVTQVTAFRQYPSGVNFPEYIICKGFVGQAFLACLESASAQAYSPPSSGLESVRGTRMSPLDRFGQAKMPAPPENGVTRWRRASSNVPSGTDLRCPDANLEETLQIGMVDQFDRRSAVQLLQECVQVTLHLGKGLRCVVII